MGNGDTYGNSVMRPSHLFYRNLSRFLINRVTEESNWQGENLDHPLLRQRLAEGDLDGQMLAVIARLRLKDEEFHNTLRACEPNGLSLTTLQSVESSKSSV